MRWNHTPNLLMRTPAPWRLFGKAAGIGGLSAVVAWSLAWGPVQDTGRRASISDMLENTPSPSMSAEVNRTPRVVSGEAVLSAARGTEPDTVRYFEASTGRVLTANLRTGQGVVLSDRKLNGLIRSWWLPGREQAISSLDRQGTSQYHLYDYATKETQALGDGITSLATSPDGRRVAFIEATDGTATLFVASPDGTERQKIISTRTDDAELTWPQETHLAMATRRPDRSGRDLTIVALDGTLTPLLANRENLEYTWSHDGQKLLFSYFAPGQGVALWYRDIRGGRDVPMDLVTSARKCAWHPGDTRITCGSPSAQTLARDTPSDLVATNDDIVSIDIESGTRTVHTTAKTGSLFGVTDPLLSSSGRYLVFTNMFDKRLYSLEL